MALQTTKYSNHTIPRISLRNFPSHIDIITSQLIHAAEQDGFFVLTDHSISQSSIDTQFAAAERFFTLPNTAKACVSLSHRNAG